MEGNKNIGIRIVTLFDILVSIFVGIKCIPSGVHISLRILIIFVIFFVAFFIMNIRKFGIGLIAIIALSLLFTWVANGFIIAHNVDDTAWKWVLRSCAFLICFLGHIKLTVWDKEIKDRFFD